MHGTTEPDVRRWTEPAGRFGLAARGFVYCVAGVVAVAVASGKRNERIDRRGAFEVLARQRYGSVVLVLLIAGFAGYAARRFVCAATGAREGGKDRDGPAGWVRRACDAGAGAIYVTLLVAAARLLAHQDPGDGGDRRAGSWSASSSSRRRSPTTPTRPSGSTGRSTASPIVPTAPPALPLVAVGLIAFGLFSFVEARWPTVLDG